MSDEPGNSNVIFLKFSTPEQVPEGITFACCKNCLNKTYTHIYDGGSEFPLVKCAACGAHIGRIGWVQE